MKIVISDVPDKGLNLDLEEKIRLEDISVISPVSACLEFTKIDGEIILDGRLSAEIELDCSRCLIKFHRILEIPVNVVYRPIEEIDYDRRELKDDEMDMEFYKGDELDVQELLKEQIRLNIQMKPLCDENCRGLCPLCGTDLNMGTCSCINKDTDPRLEVLKKLLEKRKE
jgi:uncharacterized protein